MKCEALNYLSCNVSIVVMYRVSFSPILGVKFPIDYGSFFLSTTLLRLSLKTSVIYFLVLSGWLCMPEQVLYAILDTAL